MVSLPLKKQVQQKQVKHLNSKKLCYVFSPPTHFVYQLFLFNAISTLPSFNS